MAGSDVTRNSPVPLNDFVSTSAFETLNGLMSDPNIHFIFIHGCPGSGKSTLAEHSYLKLLKMFDCTIYERFNCRNYETLGANLTNFGLVKQTESTNNGPQGWHAIQKLYYNMISNHRAYQKLFLLDDAENLDELFDNLKFLNTRIAEDKQKGKWKIVVTVQREKLPEYFVHESCIKTILLSGFSHEEILSLFRKKVPKITSDMVENIVANIGSLALPLSVCAKNIPRDLKEAKDYIRELKNSIGIGNTKKMLGSSKLAIEKLREEFGLQDGKAALTVLKIITFFNERNIPKELLISAMETVITPPDKAEPFVNQLTDSLDKRGLCTEMKQKDDKFYSLHQLVRQSIEDFITEDEKIQLMRQALISLTRMIPKDGRRQNARLDYYVEHGRRLDILITNMGSCINRNSTPLILFLHSNLLLGMGYCMLTQKIVEPALKWLKQSRNKYCRLALEGDYNMVAAAAARNLESDKVAKEVAIRLYEAGQRLACGAAHDSEEFKTYIGELPEYHRLTEKDLKNMEQRQMDTFSDENKLLPTQQLMKVYMAEILAQIYCVWSMDGYGIPTQECIENAETAVTIYKRISRDHEVYLLHAQITERGLLSSQAKSATTEDEVLRIISALEELANVDEEKKAFEAGIVRSDLQYDEYNRMLCLEPIISCHGKLYKISQRSGNADAQHYEAGKALQEDVEKIAKTQVNEHSALFYAHINFAAFQSDCGKFGEAAVTIIKAMKQLGLHLTEPEERGNVERKYGEFDDYRFRPCYDQLELYYSHVQGQAILSDSRPEYMYLFHAVRRMPGRQEAVGNSQPSETGAAPRFPLLDTILETAQS